LGQLYAHLLWFELSDYLFKFFFDIKQPYEMQEKNARKSHCRLKKLARISHEKFILSNNRPGLTKQNKATKAYRCLVLYSACILL